MSNKIIVVGSSGHASVVIEAMEQLNYEILGCIDSFAPIGKKILNYKVLGDEFILKNNENLGTNQIFIAIGNNYHRNQMYQKLITINSNLVFPSIISTSAIISPSAFIGHGNIIMDRAIIHANSIIGDFNLINTAAIVEHDCVLQDFTSISPGAVLCGNVHLSNFAFVGSLATIIQKKKIYENTFIGAGAVVMNDCEANSLYVGVPAKKINPNYNKINYL